jgi:tetratricopeptide (TPR) repeat protein
MALSRLKQLLQFWQEDPNDPFTLYALATEYRPTDPNKALFYYEKLLAEHPGYVGTYYHAAKLYAELGQANKAEDTFKKGLEVSQQAGHRNAYRELQAAYRDFMDE